MKKIVFGIIVFLSFITVFAKVSNKQEESYANIVFFAYFNGQDNTYFENNTDTILSMYNSTEKRSVTSYLEQVSYGKFHIKNYFPQLENGKIEAYNLGLDIDDYYSHNFDTNIIDKLLDEYSSNLGYNLDYNNDGFVDNVTVILLSKDGFTTTSNSTMVAHKSIYPGVKTYLGKYVGTYNILNTESIKTSEAGVITHEFMHSIGYSDLYRSNATGDSIVDEPVGSWDIMSSANYGMSYPLAYLRSRVSNWIDIEEVTTSKTLTLNPQTDKDGNQAFILKSPINEYEYFVVEYRQKGTIGDAKTLDLHIGPSGVIVYRVDTKVEGYSNYHGKTGVFVFRPLINGSFTTIYNASLGNDSYKVNSIGTSNLDKTFNDGALTFSDGSNSGIVIKNVSNLIDGKVTLDVEIPSSSNLDLWKNTNYEDTIGVSTSKKGEVIIHNKKPYAVTTSNNKISISILDSTWQVKSTYSLNTSYIIDSKVIEYNNKIHFIYTDGSKIEILAFQDSNNTWVNVGTIIQNTNSFGVSLINNKLYIGIMESGLGNFSSGFYANGFVYLYDGSNLTLLGSEKLQDGGQPKLVSYKNKIYFTYRTSKGKIGVFIFDNGKFMEVSTPFIEQAGHTFDVALFNDKLYFIEGGGTSNTTLYTYDGNTFQVKDIGFKINFPSLTISQGNLYLLATIDNSLVVYSLNEVTNTFNKEGNTVDSSGDSLNSSIISLNDIIYVTTKRTTDNEIVIKSKQTGNRLLSISITPPTKLIYNVGDVLDKTGLKVKANYTKTSKEVTNYTITNFDTSSIGIKQVAITYEGMTNTFSYTVLEKQGEYLTSITITPPTKLIYNVGDVLDKTGLKVKANYTNHSSIVTNYTILDFQTKKAGKYKATIKYLNFSKTFTYEVVNPITKTFKELANEKGYKTKSNFVYHFPLETLFSTIKSKFNETIISASANIITTGMEFKYKNETYYSVIYGDLNGDGKINSADLLKLRKHLLNQEVLTGAYKEAASVTNDDIINSADLLKIRQHLLGVNVISQ